jgi:hypothetical protein
MLCDVGTSIAQRATMKKTQIAALYEGLTLLWMLDPQAVQWEKEGEASIKLLLEGLKK